MMLLSSSVQEHCKECYFDEESHSHSWVYLAPLIIHLKYLSKQKP